jgi:uncharacterized protein (TIGR03067 family)
MRTLLIAVLAGTLLTSFALGDDNKDLEKVAGDWSVVTIEHHGKKYTEDERSRPIVTFKGNQMTVERNGGVHPGTVHIDSSKMPPQFDVTLNDGPEKGKTFEGIYKLDGDQLQLCIRDKGAGRPAAFQGGDGLLLVTLKRGE